MTTTTMSCVIPSVLKLKLFTYLKGINFTLQPEIDISVSKLLGFETFAKHLRVSVSENLVSEKSLGFGFEKIWYHKKSLGIGFGQNLASEKKKSK